MFMRIIHLVILVLLFCGSVCASAQDLKIAMVLWRGETDAEAGFKEGLVELGYNPEFQIFDCQQDVRRLGSLLHVINNDIDQFDYIYTFGTTVSRRVKVVIGGRIPQIFNIVTDPVAAGIVGDMDSPGVNISGGSDAIRIADQLDPALRLFKVGKLGFFFNPREKNSLIIRDELYHFAREHGITVIDFPSPPVQSSLLQNLQRLVENPDQVDIVYLSADSYLVSEAPLIGSYLRKAKVKSISQVRSLIDHGVMMGTAGDYYELGRAVATIVDKREKGASLRDIPVERFARFKLIMNQTTIEAIGAQIDDTVLSQAELVQ